MKLKYENEFDPVLMEYFIIYNKIVHWYFYLIKFKQSKANATKFLKKCVIS